MGFAPFDIKKKKGTFSEKIYLIEGIVHQGTVEVSEGKKYIVFSGYNYIKYYNLAHIN